MRIPSFANCSPMFWKSRADPVAQHVGVSDSGSVEANGDAAAQASGQTLETTWLSLQCRVGRDRDGRRDDPAFAVFGSAGDQTVRSSKMRGNPEIAAGKTL
jgi:hypothetical protein